MKVSGPIRVVTLADDRYAIPLAVTVRSMLDRLEPDRLVKVAVIDGGITAGTKQKLIDSWRTSPAWERASVDWVEPRYGGAESLPAWGRVPVLTYARINVDAYAPDCDRAILLDSDVLVRAGLGNLWDTPLDGAIAAAVVDPFVPTVSSRDGLVSYANFGLKPDAPYLNAGVMLIDLALWRARSVAPRAMAFAVRHLRDSRWQDQDAINAVLAGQWIPLDTRWQMQPRRANISPHASQTGVEAAWLLHFSGKLKPWIYDGGSVADVEFFSVLDRTEWRGWRPPSTARASLTRLYERRFRRYLYPLEVRMLGWWNRTRGQFYE